MKPVVLVTRKLPDSVEDRLRRDYTPILNPDDALYSGDEIIERARGPMPLCRALDNLDAVFAGREPLDRVA